MPVIVGCPSCQLRLSVGEELLGRPVRCAGCGATFQAEAPPQAPPVAAENPSHGVLDSRMVPPAPGMSSAPPPQPPSEEPRPAQQRSDSICPGCGAALAVEEERCPACGDYLEVRRRRRRRQREDEEDVGDVWRGQRRDSEPHRGSTILTCGIISIVCAPLALICCQVFSIAGLILGGLSVLWGNADLKAMRVGRMDPAGQGSTSSGWTCGLVGLILNGLAFLLLVGLLIFYGAMIATGQLK